MMLVRIRIIELIDVPEIGVKCFEIMILRIRMSCWILFFFLDG